MKFSAQEEYGMRCLLALANEGDGATLTIPQISEREGISQPLAAKVLTLLRKEGLIVSTRGQTGGYALSRTPDQINLGETFSVLGGRMFEDDFCDRFVGQEESCCHKGSCALHDLYSKIQTAVDGVLAPLTLRDLMPGNDFIAVSNIENHAKRT